MDFSKVLAALTTARTELRNAVQAQTAIITNTKSSVTEIANAAKELRSAGKIDTALTRAEEKIATVVSGKGEKKRKKKAPAAEGKK